MVFEEIEEWNKRYSDTQKKSIQKVFITFMKKYEQ